jgi:uncharacterized membrane protein YebE (DUF533 family)
MEISMNSVSNLVSACVSACAREGRSEESDRQIKFQGLCAKIGAVALGALAATFVVGGGFCSSTVIGALVGVPMIALGVALGVLAHTVYQGGQNWIQHKELIDNGQPAKIFDNTLISYFNYEKDAVRALTKFFKG